MAASDGRKTLFRGTYSGAIILGRRAFLTAAGGAAVTASVPWLRAATLQPLAAVPGTLINLARVVFPTSLTTTSENRIGVLNGDVHPQSSQDRGHGSCAVRREHGDDAPTEWVQYAWPSLFRILPNTAQFE